MITTKKEHSYGILAIVAIVAIVALFTIIKPGSYLQAPSTGEDLVGEAFILRKADITNKKLTSFPNENLFGCGGYIQSECGTAGSVPEPNNAPTCIEACFDNPSEYVDLDCNTFDDCWCYWDPNMVADPTPNGRCVQKNLGSMDDPSASGCTGWALPCGTPGGTCLNDAGTACELCECTSMGAVRFDQADYGEIVYSDTYMPNNELLSSWRFSLDIIKQGDGIGNHPILAGFAPYTFADASPISTLINGLTGNLAFGMRGQPSFIDTGFHIDNDKLYKIMWTLDTSTTRLTLFLWQGTTLQGGYWDDVTISTGGGNGAYFSIGYNTNSGGFQGIIDNVLFEVMNSDTGAYEKKLEYLFNEGAGSVVLDTSGMNIHATCKINYFPGDVENCDWVWDLS